MVPIDVCVFLLASVFEKLFKWIQNEIIKFTLLTTWDLKKRLQLFLTHVFLHNCWDLAHVMFFFSILGLISK